MLKVLLLLYFISKLCVIDAARILGVFPTPSISHQVVFRVLTQELVKRGHEVVVITADPAFSKEQSPLNLTEIDIHDISYRFVHENIWSMVKEYGVGEDLDWIEHQIKLHDFCRILEVQIKSEPVQQLIRDKRKFDVLLIEAYMRPYIVFSNIFKAPTILVSSFGATLENLEDIGAPSHPLLYPNPFRQRLYNLSLWEKMGELYLHLKYMYLEKKFNRLDDELLQKIFGPSIPSINEMSNNVDMLFLNVHPIWMDNQPVPPGVIYMGGIHQTPQRILPKNLQTYLDSSKNGVIYVSFGTNVHPYMFSSERLKMITEALSELPYDISFKWNDDELPGRTNNIKISKWFPQSDLLRHPKVKAFVMQGGLQSTDEAITAGVPLICIPMFGDQAYNAEKYVRFKIGIKLNFLTFTKSQFKDAIETVINDNSYRENIVKLRYRMSDQPQSPLERAIWWIEYVTRHGGARHLRAPAANMSWAEYYELKLVFIVLMCTVISIAICLFVVKLLIRLVASKFLNGSGKVKQF